MFDTVLQHCLRQYTSLQESGFESLQQTKDQVTPFGNFGVQLSAGATQGLGALGALGGVPVQPDADVSLSTSAEAMPAKLNPMVKGSANRAVRHTLIHLMCSIVHSGGFDHHSIFQAGPDLK